MRQALGWTLLCLLLLAGCGRDAPQPPPTPGLTPAQARGREIFMGSVARCSSCHSLEPGVRVVGPSLAGIATRAGERIPGMDARTYIELSILKPGDYIVEGYPDAMPRNIAKQITGDQLNDLVAFLLTLR